MPRNLLELLAAAAERHVVELAEPVEIRVLQNYVDRLKALVGPRIEPRTSAQVVKMADHPVAARRRRESASRTRSALAAACSYRQHWVNEYGDACYDD